MSLLSSISLASLLSCHVMPFSMLLIGKKDLTRCQNHALRLPRFPNCELNKLLFLFYYFWYKRLKGLKNARHMLDH